MRPQLLHVGFGNVVVASAREQGRVIDVAGGRRTKAVLALGTGPGMLAAVSPRTIVTRLEGGAMPALDEWRESPSPEE